MNKKLAALIAICAFSLVAPFSTASAAVFVGYATITNLNVFDSAGIARLQIDGDNSQNPASCSSSGQYAIDLSSTAGSEMYRLALASYLSGREVRLSIKDTTGLCANNYPKIDVLYVQD